MANNKNHITEKYITGKGELVGFIRIFEPSTRYNKEGKYQANILLPKEEGEKLVAKLKEVRTEQFKTFGKGTKVAELPCIPYSKINEETGETVEDSEGRYILKTKSSAYIEKGVPTRKIQVVNAKLKPVKNVKVGEGTVAKLGVVLSGYSVAGKTGVSVKLGIVQIIDLVEYQGDFSLDGFTEEDGFDGVGEDFTEEDTKVEADEDEEDLGF